jgi:squalene-associated FAD-dependent desaturase
LADRVAVIGGGLSGITAALDCADAGCEVTLVEAQAHLGGLTRSVSRNGTWFDNGQHVFLRCCDAYLGLLDRLGVADKVALQKRLDLPVLRPHARPATIRRDRLPAPLHLARSVARYSHLSIKDRARIAPAAMALRHLDPNSPGTDRQTFADWLSAHGQSDDAITYFWDLICLPTVNLHASEASLAAAAFVFQVGVFGGGGAADIGWARVPLQALHGDAAEASLTEREVRILTGCRVDAVHEARGQFEVQATSASFDADVVIVALPSQTAGDVLGEMAPVQAWATRLGRSPIVSVSVVFDRQVTDLSCAAVVDSEAQFIFDRTELTHIPRAQYLAVTMSAADHLLSRRRAALVADVVASLELVLPGVRRARVIDAFVSREPTATFRAGPGTTALRPSSRTGTPGLALAGAWTATGWPATMEGAVRSGHTAADEALEHLRGRRSRR